MSGRSALIVTLVLALASCAAPSASAPRRAEPTPAELAPEAPPAAALSPTAPAPAPEASAAPPAPAPDAPPHGDSAWQERLIARARTFLGRRGPFRVAGERFNGDCSGFVEAVYTAEGLRLRDLVTLEAPAERSAAKGLWMAAQQHGRAFGAGATPSPGDLVFWNDTYDRNHNRRADDPYTHVGIVEQVEDGTVHFLHRGRRGVARGVMTLARSHEARAVDGHPLNSQLRVRSHPVKRGGLAGELFAGYVRLDAASPRREGAVAAAAQPSSP